jgi:hypothetical protein
MFYLFFFKLIYLEEHISSLLNSITNLFSIKKHTGYIEQERFSNYGEKKTQKIQN